MVRGKVIQINKVLNNAEIIESKKQEITGLYRESIKEKCMGEESEKCTEQYKVKCMEQYKNESNELIQWLDENGIQDNVTKCFCYRMITYYYLDMREYDKSLFSAEYALNYAEGLDEAKVHQIIGISYKELKQIDEAEKHLNKSLKYYKNHDLYFEMAQIYDIKGELLSSESMFNKAITSYNRAENTESANQNKYNYDKCRSRVYMRLLRLYIRKDEDNFIKCYGLYNKIQDAAIKKEASKLIKSAYGKEV